jgi:hypothetical protein
MPGKWSGERSRGVLDVNHPAVHRTRGRARSVKQQRAKREERTLRSKANRFGKRRAELVDFRCGETTEAVCSVENSHRSIVLATWVQMQTDREHLLEHFDRRLNMGDAGLVGPVPIARHVDAFAGSHREVLVPDDLPVRIRRFVEEKRANGEAGFTEHRIGESTECGRRRERRNARLVEQVACTTTSGLDERCDAIAKLGDGSRPNDGLRHCPPRRGDRFLKREKFVHYSLSVVHLTLRVKLTVREVCHADASERLGVASACSCVDERGRDERDEVVPH